MRKLLLPVIALLVVGVACPGTVATGPLSKAVVASCVAGVSRRDARSRSNTEPDAGTMGV